MIKRAFNKLWNNERGNVLIIAGAALPLLVGSAGLATDTIQWTLWKRQLQRAADSAAIAGVYQRVQQDTQAAVDGAVANDLSPTSVRMTFVDRTGLTLNAGSPLNELLADDLAVPDIRNRVRVTLETQKALTFSSMFMATPPVIRAVATAASVPGADEYCVIGLDPSATAIGIEVSGSTDIDMGECSLIANSRHANRAATNNGNGSTLKAKSMAAVGGVQNSASWDVDHYYPSSSPVIDPLLSLPVPAACNKSITVGKKDFPINRTTQGDAGQVVCINGGLDVQGTMTLAAATYVINGGDLSMNATGTKLSCVGCTIILSNLANPALTGNISLNGGTLDLVAPTAAGTYQGVALFQDRRAPDDGKVGTNKINGNSSSGVVGAIYTPSRSLLYNGGGKLTATCVQIIARRVTFSGSSKIQLSSDCGDAVPGPIGGGTVVRLVA